MTVLMTVFKKHHKLIPLHTNNLPVLLRASPARHIHKKPALVAGFFVSAIFNSL